LLRQRFDRARPLTQQIQKLDPLGSRDRFPNPPKLLVDAVFEPPMWGWHSVSYSIIYLNSQLNQGQRKVSVTHQVLPSEACYVSHRSIEKFMPDFLHSLLLLFATAVAEIVGCYLPYLWLRRGGSVLLLIPAVLSLALFAWLLSLHPTAAGRIYAAYGGVYIAVAVSWLWLIERQSPNRWDLFGAGLCVVGAALILFGAYKH
jgi:small multidrug resistance family-3 protein